MQRSIAFSSVVGLVVVYAACAKEPAFHELRTPSGDFCSDMPIFSGMTQPDREFHRIGPVKSRPKLNSPAERLESLRKAACAAGADAIVEAAEAEETQPDATHSTIASGTGVIWTRRPDTEAKPLGLGAVTEDNKSAPKEAVATPTAKAPTPLDTSVEVKSPPPAPTPAATPEPPATTAPATTATTAPATTTTTKTTTKTKTKTK